MDSVGRFSVTSNVNEKIKFLVRLRHGVAVPPCVGGEQLWCCSCTLLPESLCWRVKSKPSLFHLRDHLTVTFCSVSHRKICRKPSDKLTADQLLMCFIYSTIGALAFFDTARLCVLIKGLANWLNSPKMKGSPFERNDVPFENVSLTVGEHPPQDFWKSGNLTVLWLSPWRRREGLIRVEPEKSVLEEWQKNKIK